MSAGQWRTPNTDDVIGCSELPCVDVGVGIYHHPYCGMRRDDPDLNAPATPEEEEELLARHPDRPVDPLEAAERELRLATEALAMVEHGADDAPEQRRYAAALAARNSLRP